MTVIGTNTASLRAANASNMANAKLQTAMQRLSTGSRINSAKDDAAGLAISDSMTSQIRGMTQAVRNANDGISMAQTADGALNEVTNMLQRIRELAVQSASGTYSDGDRANMQTEVTALTGQISSILSSTKFNNVGLFDGSAGAAASTGAGTGTGGTSGTGTGTGTGGTSGTGGTDAGTGTGGTDAGTGTGGTDAGTGTGGTDAGTSTGGTDAGTGTGGTGAGTGTSGTGTGTGTGTSGTGTGTSGTGTGSVVIQVGSNASDTVTMSFARINLDSAVAVNIGTAAGATAALSTINDALTTVDTARAGFGAAESQLTSVVNNLNSNVENLSDARSQIQDTDFSAETANLAKAQILTQASTAMLAQANQSQQGVLKLLQ